MMIYSRPGKSYYAEENRLCVTQIEREDSVRTAEKRKSWASKILTLLLASLGMSYAKAVQSSKDSSTRQTSRCGKFQRRENGSSRASCSSRTDATSIGRVGDFLARVAIERSSEKGERVEGSHRREGSGSERAEARSGVFKEVD